MNPYDYEYRRERDRILREHSVCWLCGRAVDFDAPARSPESPSIDHVIPVKTLRGVDPRTRREVLTNPDGLRLAHLGCNSSRGAGRAKKNNGISRSWL